MTVKALFDTNILVYAYDRAAGIKRQQALAIFRYLSMQNYGALSTQVLAEFFVTVTRKIPNKLSTDDAAIHLQNLTQIWTVFDVTTSVILEAVRGVSAYQFSLWDAQIWAVARLNQVAVVLSEDFNTGAVIEGVRFINPFAMTTPIENWLP